MSGRRAPAPAPSTVGFCAALLDTAHTGDDPVRLAGDVEWLAAHLSPIARVGLRAGLAATDASAVALTGRRLAALDAAARDRVLDRLAGNGVTGPLFDALKAAVLLATGATKEGPGLIARAGTVPAARPDADLDVTPAREWPSRTVADVVIVGSGAGGAMVARTLARAGLRTVVVEEGRRWSVDEFRGRPPLERFVELYREAGATAALGRPPVMLPIGRGVGGTTLVNSGTCYRPPEKVLLRWRDDEGLAFADPDAFAPHLDEVERTLRVGPVPDDVMGRNGRLALAGAAALGWRAHPITRNAPGCAGSCQCAIGCPRNAKFGVHLNALPDACAAGARIVSEARVERVLHGDGRATGIRARRRDGSTFEILAARIVVAAGATETPLLLRRSGLGRHHRLGRNLALHPAVSAAGRFDEPVVAWEGVLQSVGIDEHHEREGVLIEATSTPPGMGTMLLPGHGGALVAELEGADHLATIGAMIADEPSGRVLGRRRAVLTYDLTRADGARLVRAIGHMGRVLFAAGAYEVLTGIPGNMRVRTVAELDDALAGADVRTLHLAAFHPTGTAAAGADPERHPVDPAGRLRGVRGVWVADASVLPTCPEVNPQVSIMAAALAVAAGIAS